MLPLAICRRIFHPIGYVLLSQSLTFSIVERDLSNVFILNEKYAYFILNRIKYWALFIQNSSFLRGCDGCEGFWTHAALRSLDQDI